MSVNDISAVERILSESLIREIEGLSKQFDRIEANMQRIEDKQEASINRLALEMKELNKQLAEAQKETALNKLKISMWGFAGGAVAGGAIKIFGPVLSKALGG